ncbi:MAG: hypothetical protein EXQ85_03480 [Alphaproteobacteria bacterium]|nr:hypothetical protein [Alphaproteobacteria bacterium]
MLESDVRRLLTLGVAHSAGIVLMVAGLGGPASINAALLLAVVSTVALVLQATATGTAVYLSGELQAARLGGLAVSMPLTATASVLAAASSMFVPLTGGYAAFALATDAARDEAPVEIWLMLWVAAAIGCLHVGLRCSWLVFFGRDSGLRPPDPPASMRWAMTGVGFLLLALGLYPPLTYLLGPYAVAVDAFSPSLLLTQGQVIVFAVLAFFLSLPLQPSAAVRHWDVDWLWRRLLPASAGWAMRLAASLNQNAGGRLRGWLRRAAEQVLVWLKSRARMGAGRTLSHRLSLVALALLLALALSVFYASPR